MSTTTPATTDEDWSWLEEAVQGRPATTTPKPAPRPPPEELLRVRTADEILAADTRATPEHVTAPERNGKHVTAPATGVVYADDHPAPPMAGPTAPSTSSNSPELAELRALRAELTSLCALVATAINKLAARRGA